MEKLDIVYVLKNGWKTPAEELKYSLRSVERNFPHARVWFFGGQPPGLKPDRRRPFQQEGAGRYERVTNTLARICSDGEVSSSFWLFNDDFFILRPVTQAFAYDRGDIYEHIRQLYKRWGFKSGYMKTLEKGANALKEAGKPTKDYTLHIPMLIERERALEALDAFPGQSSFRNIYGNYTEMESETIQDVKITNISTGPDPGWTFCSTSDGAFASGLAGAIIAKEFPEPSKWEVQE